LNQERRKQYARADQSLKKALQCLSDHKYTYIYYYLAAIRSELGEHEIARKLLENIVKEDSLILCAYDDLFVYELNINKNFEKAEYYKQKLISYMPWYESRLNAIEARIEKRSAGNSSR
jgi:hypothetical protein